MKEDIIQIHRRVTETPVTFEVIVNGEMTWANVHSSWESALAYGLRFIEEGNNGRK